MFEAQSAFNRTVVNTLLNQLEAQSTGFERQLASNLAIFQVITDCLNQLERNLENLLTPRIAIISSRLVPLASSDFHRRCAAIPAPS